MTITQSSTRLAALTIGVAAVVTFAFAAISIAPAHAAAMCPGTTWTKALSVGSSNSEVMALQQFLNMDPDTMVSSTGAGSPGMETMYYGAKTKAAVMKFQAKNGISQLGIVGPMTRAKVNALCAGGTTMTPPGTTPAPTPSATSVTVSAGAQPANAIAPKGASRVPFTNFSVTAPASGSVTISSVTVQRQGPSLDTDFAGVVLVDARTGIQIGTARVLDANHQASVGVPVTIPAGATMNFTVAGNIAAAPGAGNIASFAVVAVNTTATVQGSLPIIGASNTINASLTLGSATLQSSSFDPNTASTQPIGTTGYRFTGVRVQAGATEDVTFKSITWYQSGSASGLQNVMTVVNGTSYPTVADSTGRYYTSVFPTGIVIPKGGVADVYVQGDLGANTTSNTYSEFDIYRNTDVYLVGNTYGFGITPTTGGAGTYNSTNSHATIFVTGETSTPWVQGSTVSVTAGQFSTIQNASSVGAQNVAVNVPNQPLGGFQTNITGEGVQTQTLNMHFTTSAALQPLTNVTLVNESGAIVAGPYNAKCTANATSNTDTGTTLGSVCGAAFQAVAFTGAITFPTGSHTYVLKGQLDRNVGNGATVQASTNPSNDWQNVTGVTTGNTVSIGIGSFTMNTMTVQAASLTESNGTTPTAQQIVAGGSNITFATVQLNASQSGEDLRISSLPIKLTTTDTVSKLSNCQLWDGASALNTGSYVVNGSSLSSTSPVTATFSFNNSLTVAKGTVKTLTLTCTLSSSASASGQYTWDANAGTWTATGAVSGAQVTITTAGGTAPLMTVSSGASLAVTTDSSAPSYTLVAGGATGVTLDVIKLRATNEAVNLQKIGLRLTNTASSSAADVSQVYLYAGNNVKDNAGNAVAAGTLLGTLTFTGGATTGTTTLSSIVQLPRDTDSTIVVKGDVANVGTNNPGTSGHLVAVDYLNSEGTGANSGSTIKSGLANFTGSTAAGVRVWKTNPTVAAGPAAGSNPNGANQVLKKFAITAGSGANGVSVYQLTVAIATSNVSVTNVQLHAYTDSGYSQPANVPTTTGGQFGATLTPSGSSYTAIFTQSTPLSIGAGQTIYFTMTGNAAPTSGANNWTVTATLNGDTAFPSLSGFTDLAANLNANNVVWSPNTNGASAAGTSDWTNGYGVSGLPSTGL